MMDARAYLHDPDRLIDEHEAANLLGLSVRTLQAWRVKGGGPRFVRLGRAIRYRRSDIRDCIDQNTRQQTSPADRRTASVG